MQIYIHCSVCVQVCKQYIYLHLRDTRCRQLRHISISEFCLPSRNVFRLIALERDLVVHGSGRTATALGHHPVPADVELLAVIRMREGGVWQCPSVGANHLPLRTRKAVFQRLCAEHHITVITESDCTFINTRVNTRWSSTQATVRTLPQIWLHLPPSIPFIPLQIVAACTNSDVTRCYTFRVTAASLKEQSKAAPVHATQAYTGSKCMATLNL